jgi:hypothetical protein
MDSAAEAVEAVQSRLGDLRSTLLKRLEPMKCDIVDLSMRKYSDTDPAKSHVIKVEATDWILGQRMNHDPVLFYVYIGCSSGSSGNSPGLAMTIENYYAGLNQKYYQRHILLEEVVEEVIRGWWAA